MQAGIGEAVVARGSRDPDRERAARRVAGKCDAGRRNSLIKQPTIRLDRVLNGSRTSMFGRKPIFERENPRPGGIGQATNQAKMRSDGSDLKAAAVAEQDDPLAR